MCDFKTKICKKCNIEKDISNFYIRKTSKDGYRNECKECGVIMREKYFSIEENKNKHDEKNKIWRENNKKRLKENMNNFLEKNKDYQKEWYIKNKNNINERNKKRRDIDNNYKLKENIRNLVKNSLRYKNYKKKQKTIDILGCDNNEFKTYLESKFEPWMNWGNYGLYNGKECYGWDIDHIIPISTAKTEEDIIRLNHYTNLRPLCSYNNRVIKRAK